MRARALYLLIAREVSTDVNDNMNTITKIIDKFGASLDVPSHDKSDVILLPIKFAIASLWLFESPLKDTSKISIRLDIEDPTGKKIGGVKQDGDFQAGVDRVSFNFNNEGLPVTASGIYTLHANLYAN